MSPRNAPELPDEVKHLSVDILEELTDPKHIQRLHGKRGCYTAGCRGPLCKRADRLFNRQRYEEQRKAAGKPYNPSELRLDDRDDELDSALLVYMRHMKSIEIHVRLTELYREIADGLVS
jgi:hypothetical protein